jgi:predicted metal-binding membrane protein
MHNNTTRFPAVASSGVTVTAVRRFIALHPEWWSVGLGGLAAISMLSHGWKHWGHSFHHWMTFGGEFSGWLLMIAAMMLPIIAPTVREAGMRSRWSRRHRAIALFLVGYFAPWLLLGVVIASLRGLPAAHTPWAASVMFGVAIVWMLTRTRRRVLIQYHRLEPLEIEGWRADLSCFRFGKKIGTNCAILCWPVMLACAITGHDLPAMILGGAFGAIERFSFRPRFLAPAVILLTAATYYLACSFSP